MKPIYADVASCRALVASGNPTQRSLQASTLREMGVGHLVQASRIEEVRRLLENGAFDIVLCDYHFDQSSMTGQDLLDELRSSNALPYATVFIMVTGEASYAMVAEAAESALDGYLLKPYTTAALEQRMLQARHRKLVLKTIFDAIETGDLARAAGIGQARFDARSEFALTAARIAAELFIRLGRYTAAADVYKTALQAQALPWASLGLARTQLETGALAPAVATLQELVHQRPDYADAWDLLGRAQFESGELVAALNAYRSAVRLTPYSVARLQRLGMLAFYLGTPEETLDALERVVRLGLGTRVFDCQTLVLLAMLQFDKLDVRALTRTTENLRLKASRQPDDRRLQRFVATVDTLQSLNERTRSACALRAEAQAGQTRTNDFDFEAATNLLALLMRLDKARVPITEMPSWVDTVAQRFCVCSASTELLAHALREQEPFAGLIRAGHARITGVAEQAMGTGPQGDPASAAQSVLLNATETLNARLIDLASQLIADLGPALEGSADLGARASELQRLFGTKRHHVVLGIDSGRATGALNIRA